jgi:hypothetical protein
MHVGKDVKKSEPCVLLVGMQNDVATVENYMTVPQKVSIELSLDSIIPLLNGYSNELRAETLRDAYTTAKHVLPR